MEYKGLGDVEFIQVIGGQSFVIRCRYCDGTGRQPRKIDIDDLSIKSFASDPSTCPVCQAKGMLRLSSPDVPCNCGTCRGTGRMSGTFGSDPSPHISMDDWFKQNRDSAKPCYRCEGYGILSLTGSVSRVRER
jgi:DnaJ-class molecular chaperone